MATGILYDVGFTERELLEMRDTARDILTENAGTIVTQDAFWSGNGVKRETRYEAVEGMDIREFLREIAFALWKTNPTKYPKGKPGFKKVRVRY